ncbi:MAG: MBL fold metallo-hydrolase [Planctomycetota bacterium]|nr:MBL fold metallo-hydrolase [Planctomycetota bacterium]
MRLIVCGSGDAHGIPRPDCADPDCACARARRGAGTVRRQSCAVVEAADTRIAIDTGSGFQPCAALLLTHYHPDHAGRREAFAGVPAWGPDPGCEVPGLERFPAPDAVQFVAPFATLRIGALQCTALPLNHPIPAMGWAISDGRQRLAWLTDSYGIPAPTIAWLRAHPCSLIALDTTFPPGEPSAPRKGHGTLDVSLAALAAVGARRALLIHIGHRLQRWLEAGGALPEGVAVARDGESYDA